ncbi:hypothetical protein ACQ3G6_17385 [Allorhizobium undicola]|uniref:hypothetical protein n=1 Tax=Allorhizobium undicola TaxID=78527 RepID=UPI003D325866
MADRPILFSAPMVRALLAGTKTQTRRILKPQPMPDMALVGLYAPGLTAVFGYDTPDADFKVRLRSIPGDRLWVRETWQALSFGDYQPTKCSQSEVRYAATDPCAYLDTEARGYPWRPSIFMPRWASRLTLIVTDVRVERLQDISQADAKAEGAKKPMMIADDDPCTYIDGYADLWDSINGQGAWEANPWVAAYTFTVHRCNIDQMAAP